MGSPGFLSREPRFFAGSTEILPPPFFPALPALRFVDRPGPRGTYPTRDATGGRARRTDRGPRIRGASRCAPKPRVSLVWDWRRPGLETLESRVSVKKRSSSDRRFRREPEGHPLDLSPKRGVWDYYLPFVLPSFLFY